MQGKYVKLKELRSRKGKNSAENNESKPEYSFNIQILSDKNVGKHAFIRRAIEDTFHESYIVYDKTKDFYVKNIEINERVVKLQLCPSVRVSKRSLPSPDAIIFVLDITDRVSFNNMSLWLQESEKCIHSDTLKILIATKADLVTKRVVYYDEMKSFAEENDFDYFSEVSSKTGENVEDVITTIAEDLLEKHYPNSSESKETHLSLDKNFVDTLRNSSGYRGLQSRAAISKDVLKRQAITKLLNDIDEAIEADDIDRLKTLIEAPHLGIIKNTGTGFYRLLGCITGGAQSTSHKHLMQLQNDFAVLYENLEQEEDEEQQEDEGTSLK